MGKGPYAQLAVVVRRQHGPFRRNQALAAGFSPNAIKHNIGCGRWLVLHRSVYCDAVTPASLKRDASAAVLACGSSAAVSHRTAGALWDEQLMVSGRPEVVVVAPSRVRVEGVVVHMTERLGRSEAAIRDGIRCTTPMRTLLDLAGSVDAAMLELTLDRLWRRGLVQPGRLWAYLDDEWSRTRRGSSVLRRLVGERLGDRASGSDIETLFLQLVRDANLPMPARQHPVVTPFGLRYLDLAYVDPRIAIELDGMEHRMDPEVFLDERARQNLIEAEGWTFRRFGHAHVTRASLWTIFTIAEALRLTPIRWKCP